MKLEPAALGQLEAVLQRRDPAAVVESSEPVTALGSQLVGLSVKSGLSRRIESERMSSGMPCRIVGIGSEMAVTWAVFGST